MNATPEFFRTLALGLLSLALSCHAMLVVPSPPDPATSRAEDSIPVRQSAWMSPDEIRAAKIAAHAPRVEALNSVKSMEGLGLKKQFTLGDDDAELPAYLRAIPIVCTLALLAIFAAWIVRATRRAGAIRERERAAMLEDVAHLLSPRALEVPKPAAPEASRKAQFAMSEFLLLCSRMVHAPEPEKTRVSKPPAQIENSI